MVHQHIVADIVFVLRLILEIGAGVFFHHAVLEIDLQILVIQTIQIYLSEDVYKRQALSGSVS